MAEVSGLEWTEFHFIWNCKEPLFRDKRVRTAMSYAVDYKELIERLRFGLDEQCSGIFHPTARWCQNPRPRPFSKISTKPKNCSTKPAGRIATATAFATRSGREKGEI